MLPRHAVVRMCALLLPLSTFAAPMPGVETDMLPAKPPQPKVIEKVVPKVETRVVVQTKEVIRQDPATRKKLTQVEEENQRLKERLDALERQAREEKEAKAAPRPLQPLPMVPPPQPAPVMSTIVVEPPPVLPPLRAIHGWPKELVLELQQQTARALNLPVVGKPCAICPEEVVIPAGKFVMGTLPEDGGAIKERDSRGRTHEVTLSQPYAMGQTEVSQNLWRAIMGGNPSFFANCGGDCPVEEVTWFEVQTFIKRLNAKTGLNYRLPTEAEWEYAARAGTSGAFSFSGTIGPHLVNYNPLIAYQGTTEGTWRYMTVVAGSLPANTWGLHEMHGNVAEWVADCWHENYDGAPSDGHQTWGREGGGDCANRVARGGSWMSLALFVRSASRDYFAADDRYNRVGLRLVRSLGDR